MPAPPIYRPGKRIDGPLADNEDERPKLVVSCWAQRSIWLPIERDASLRSGWQATRDYYRWCLLNFFIGLGGCSEILMKKW